MPVSDRLRIWLEYHYHECPRCGHVWSHTPEDVDEKLSSHNCPVCHEKHLFKDNPSPEKKASADRVYGRHGKYKNEYTPGEKTQ